MANEISILVSKQGLDALADMALAPKNQALLDDLLSRNAEGHLSTQETQELDVLLKKIDELNLVKARAAFTLKQMGAKEQK